MSMNEKQYNIYDGAHGLDPEIQYEVIDSLLGSNYGEKSIRSSEEIYHCEKES